MKKYILFYCNFQYETGLLDDLLKVKNLSVHDVKRTEYKNIMLKAIRKIHLNEKINKIINLPFKYIWYDLNKIKFNNEDEYFLLITPDTFFIYDKSIFNKLNKRKNIHLIFLIFDSIEAKTPICKKIKENLEAIDWDYAFTFDYEESIKYNIDYLDEAYYSKPEIADIEGIENTDAYYLGALKPGREDLTIKLFQKLYNNDVKSKFDLFRYNGIEKSIENDCVNYMETRKPYREFLPDICKTNCIIEILQEGQKGQTLRYFEAVCFNKKLLTNNNNIKNLKFYNEKYMKVYNDLNDIDINWIKKKENIDYGYNNEFSPLNLLERIKAKYSDGSNK